MRSMICDMICITGVRGEVNLLKRSVENGFTRLVSVRIPLETWDVLMEARECEGLSTTGIICKCINAALRERAIVLARQRSLARIKARREQKQHERRC